MRAVWTVRVCVGSAFNFRSSRLVVSANHPRTDGKCRRPSLCPISAQCISSDSLPSPVLGKFLQFVHGRCKAPLQVCVCVCVFVFVFVCARAVTSF